MRKHLKRPSPAMGVALVALFIALSGTTYAATGGNFILGQANTATTQTALSSNVASAPTLNVVNTGGRPAARFQANGGKAPFTVSNSTKIANLNSDLLDGLDSSAFQRVTSPTKWHYIGDPGEPAFQNGWVNYDVNPSHVDAQWQHAAYRVDNDGIVHLAGLVKNGTVGAPIFSLSGTNCPWFFHAFPVIANNALARLTVQWVTPTCAVYTENGSNAWVSLSGISFRSWPHDSSLTGAQLQKLKSTGALAGRQIR